MSKYLDITGLAYFWEKAKTYISTIIPTKTSDLVNDRGYITTYAETDPTVPAWAKTINKPTYTAAEVNAVPITRTINGQSLESDIVINIPDPSLIDSVDFPLVLDSSNLELNLIDNDNNAKRISSISLQSYSGVTGLQFNYTDGYSSGLVFLPDGVSMNNKYQEAMSLMPASTSDLINDSGFIDSVAVSSSGSGNVVTGLSASGDTITYNLGDVVPITRTINSKPLSSDVILKISDLTNDSGFINSISVSSSGSGNVVTGLSTSGNTITYTLGNVSTNAAQIIRNNSTTDINTLKIHYLTQTEYETALANNQINENELYFTPEQ